MSLARRSVSSIMKGRWRSLGVAWGMWAVLTLPASALSFDPKTGVLPRLISPNGDGINDVVYFKLDNPTLAEIYGAVFDMSGGEVATLTRVTDLSIFLPETVDALQWDGRDRSGRRVPAGPYVFRIQGDGNVFSGVVVVAQ